MRMKKIFIPFLTLLFSSLLLMGQTRTDLTPKEEYMAKEDPRELTKKVKDKVELTAGSDMWDGKDEVPKNVTPLRITIDNGGEDPIIVRYNGFELNNSEGYEYSALPLYQMDTELEKLIVDKDVRVIPEPYYEFNNHFIYPIYGPIYTGIETTQYDYIIDQEIQEKFLKWETMNADLPTQEMRRKALPEGILDRDGIVSGFLFFEKVRPTDDVVDLEFDIINARTGETKDTIEIPFYVM